MLPVPTHSLTPGIIRLKGYHYTLSLDEGYPSTTTNPYGYLPTHQLVSHVNGNYYPHFSTSFVCFHKSGSCSVFRNLLLVNELHNYYILKIITDAKVSPNFLKTNPTFTNISIYNMEKKRGE